MADTLTELQIKIIEHISKNYGLDGIDVATHLKLPIDTVYSEIYTLIESGWLKREYIGVVAALSVTRPTPPTAG